MHSSIESEDTFQFSFPKVRLSGMDSPTGIEISHGGCFSSPGSDIVPDYNLHESQLFVSIDSALHFQGDADYSTEKPKVKQASAPNVSPELLHLVDSAIMGKPESLEKLRNIVSGVESFGGDEEAVRISYMVVDSLLATMGGVESFEEGEYDNPPSVMLNSRAAIVAGELIPWLSDIGDFEGFLSPRSRMVRGLLAILRACTRNRAKCFVAWLLGVLLRSADRIFSHDIGSTEKMEWDGTLGLILQVFHVLELAAGQVISTIALNKDNTNLLVSTMDKQLIIYTDPALSLKVVDRSNAQTGLGR